MSGMSVCPAFRHRLRSLWHQFFRTIALMEFVLKNPCQQLCSFSLAPCQRSYVCMSHGPGFGNFGKSWAHSFSEKSCWWNLSWKTRANSCAFLVSLPANEAMHVPTELSPSYFPRFPLRPPSVPGALPELFPTVCSPSHPVLATISLLHNGALPKLFPTVSPPSTLSSLPFRSFPTELSPSYFPQFPLRPPCRRFHLAPSQRSSPRAISHGFPSVHPVVASVSLLSRQSNPNETKHRRCFWE